MGERGVKVRRGCQDAAGGACWVAVRGSSRADQLPFAAMSKRILGWYVQLSGCCKRIPVRCSGWRECGGRRVWGVGSGNSL